jgi:4a-hydroxytetrahydrobiopterin dehydratase
VGEADPQADGQLPPPVWSAGVMQVLAREAIADFCAAHADWTYVDGSLRATFTAPDFPTAIAWVDAVAVTAEEMDHHPDIDIRWRTLHFTLSTHSAGGVTPLDTELAERITSVVG